MSKFMLLLIVVLSSGASFAIINMLFFKLNILQFISIELIITGSHWFYNKAKNQILTVTK